MGPLDFVPAVAFLVPGFLVLTLLRRFRGLRALGGEFQASVFSLAISALILLVYAGWFGVSDVATLANHTLAHPWKTLSFLTVSVTAMALLLAAMFVSDPMTWIVRKILFSKKGGRIPEHPIELWDFKMAASANKPILVVTKTGDEFRGFLRGFSVQDESRAVLLEPVEEIAYDSRGKAKTTRLGKGMLLLGDDIQRVILL